MNLKKIYLYVVFVTAALSFNACDDNEVDFVEPNHRVVYTSQMDFDNKINVNGFLDFGDISAGVTSRTWTFPENVVDIVGSDNDQTATSNIVKAVFNKAGQYNVQLHQVFKGDAYVGMELRGKELDTTIIVNVLGPVMATINARLINKDGSLGDALSMVDNAENEVTASRSVQFTYEANGEPENFVWNFEGGDPLVVSTGQEETDVKYKKMGTYDVKFIASRDRPYGGDTIYLKDVIRIIASTDPVDLEGVTDQDGNIALVFSREMDAFTLNKSDFSVIIENGGNTITPVITKATVDASEGNIVILTLENETLYDDDIIKVSYTPGVLATLDAVLATAFTDAQLKFQPKSNLFAEAGYSDVDYSFETTKESNWPYLWWGGNWGEYDLELSYDKAYEGSKSAYIELRPNGGMIIGNVDDSADKNFITFPVEKGKYEMGVWVYVVDLGAATGAEAPDLRLYWRPGTFWGVAANPAFTADYTTGEWVYSSAVVEFSEAKEISYLIRGNNPSNLETLKFYMDNLTLSKLTSRP